MHRIFASRLAAVLLLATVQVAAHNAPASPSTGVAVTNLQAVVVRGAQPGPGLWKVSHEGHVMWVLGVISPLPKHMQWQSSEVEQAMAGSQQVLQLPAVKLKTDVGFFGKLFLLPSLFRARKIPDGGTLQQQVSATDYARWRVLKKKYIGHDRGIERWRPIFAALQLFRKALRQHDLDFGADVGKAVERIAKRHDVPVKPVVWQLVINDPRAAIKRFTRSGLDGTTCFHRTVSTLESQLPQIVRSANAWATGDITALRSVPPDPAREACLAAVTETGLARQLGMDDISARIEASWITAVQQSMRIHRQTFALMPMRELLKRGGPLDDLQALGYTVQPPD